MVVIVVVIFIGLIVLEISKSEQQPNLIQILEKIYKPNHFECFNQICEQINKSEFLINSKYLIVGDIHGSILQLFMPLKQANIIKEIEFDLDSINKFNVKINDDGNYIQTIYCGDFVGRAKHPFTTEMLLTFIDIYEKINIIKPETIIWVFGNHDIGFIRRFCLGYRSQVDVFQPEFRSIVDSPLIRTLQSKLLNVAKNNKYPCIYHNDDVIVSHTCIPQINTGLAELFEMFKKLEWENTTFNDLELDDQIDFINDLAKYHVIFNSNQYSFDVENLLYWLRPGISGMKYFKPDGLYFIGHTPIDIIGDIIAEPNESINQLNNSDELPIIKQCDYILTDFEITSAFTPKYLIQKNILTDIEIGYYMCLFLIVDLNLNVHSSKLLIV